MNHIRSSWWKLFYHWGFFESEEHDSQKKKKQPDTAMFDSEMNTSSWQLY